LCANFNKICAGADALGERGVTAAAHHAYTTQLLNRLTQRDKAADVAKWAAGKVAIKCRYNDAVAFGRPTLATFDEVGEELPLINANERFRYVNLRQTAGDDNSDGGKDLSLGGRSLLDAGVSGNDSAIIITGISSVLDDN